MRENDRAAERRMSPGPAFPPPPSMQFSINSAFLFLTGAGVALMLTKQAATLYGKDGSWSIVHLAVGSTAAWGFAYGALAGCPWRGLLIGLCAAALAYYGYQGMAWL